MALIRWLGQDDMWNRMEQMGREVDRANVYPAMNVYDDGESYIVRAEIPGVDPATLDISVTGDTLTLRGKREVEPAGDNCCYHRRERNSGEFRRAFTLPDMVDNAKVVASAKHGVLEIMLPRAEQAKQRKIEIKSS
ncbi:MAG: Hsp20/alpha crystallin family protein [Deltaproteobacteria bacterium]|nr:Hsp20/alpha crystallin family protein [Deltaproteobacteria bacterium]